MRRRVQGHVADLELRTLDRILPAKQRTHTGQELGERKRLGQIVVGPTVEAGYPVLQRATGGEHQDGHRVLVPPQVARDIHPMHIGQHQVKNNQVVRRDVGQGERVPTSVDDVHCIPFLFEPAFESAGDLRLIFDQEQSHHVSPYRS